MYLTLRDRPQRERVGGSIRQRVASTVILLGIVSMFTDIATESVNAVLPKYLIFTIGLSPQAFGFVNGLYNGVSALIRIVGGWISDRTDHPKWVAFVGYFGSALSRVWLLFATSLSAISIIVTADRLGKGLRTAPRDALIATASPPEQLGRAYGVHRSLDSLGAAIGPLMAFWILTFVTNGFHAVFVASVAFSLVGVAILLLIVPDMRPRRRTLKTDSAAVAAHDERLQPQKSARVSMRTLANPAFARLVISATLLGVLTVGDAFLYLQLQLRDNLANNYYALLMVGMNVAYLGLAIPLGRLADRVGRAWIFLAGHVALLACYLCAAGPLVGPTLTIGTLVLLGTYYAATDGTLAALAGRISDPALRTSGIATAQTFQALAGFVSSLVVGLLWAHIGLQHAILWFCPSLLLALPVAGSLLLGSRRRRASVEAAAR
jgi:MFS family permease